MSLFSLFLSLMQIKYLYERLSMFEVSSFEICVYQHFKFEQTFHSQLA